MNGDKDAPMLVVNPIDFVNHTSDDRYRPMWQSETNGTTCGIPFWFGCDFCGAWVVEIFHRKEGGSSHLMYREEGHTDEISSRVWWPDVDDRPRIFHEVINIITRCVTNFHNLPLSSDKKYYFRAVPNGKYHIVYTDGKAEPQRFRSECGASIKKAFEILQPNTAVLGAVCNKCKSGVGIHGRYYDW